MRIDLPLTDPSTLPAGFRAVPHQDGWLIIRDGADVECEVYNFGSKLGLACTVNGVRGDWIKTGDALLDLRGWPSDYPVRTDFVAKVLGDVLDLGYLMRPRIRAVLENFTSEWDGDYGFINRRNNRKRWLGEAMPPSGQEIYDYWNAIGAEGYNNAHYDIPFWCYVNGILNPGKVWAIESGTRWAIGQATRGFIWSGPERGQYRYEKGYDCVGGSAASGFHPAREKEWDRSIVMAWHMTGLPIFRMMLEMRRDFLRTIPANWWGGEWGARIPARVLDNMLVLEEGMGYPVGDKAEAFARHVMTLVDPVRGYWLNRGNGGTAPTSPWGVAENCHAIHCWAERRPSMADLLPQIQRIAERIAEDGINRQHGFPICWYRFPGHPESSSNQNFGLAGFLLPMLRWSDPALAQEIMDTTATYVPALVSQAIGGTIPPISDIRCDYGPQGAGGYKLMLEVLHGARKR